MMSDQKADLSVIVRCHATEQSGLFGEDFDLERLLAKQTFLNKLMV